MFNTRAKQRVMPKIGSKGWLQFNGLLYNKLIQKDILLNATACFNPEETEGGGKKTGPV